MFPLLQLSSGRCFSTRKVESTGNTIQQQNNLLRSYWGDCHNEPFLQFIHCYLTGRGLYIFFRLAVKHYSAAGESIYDLLLFL